MIHSKIALCDAGVYARTAFKGLARALGTLVRLDCLAAQNAHLPHAFAMFKRCAMHFATSAVTQTHLCEVLTGKKGRKGGCSDNLQQRQAP